MKLAAVRNLVLKKKQREFRLQFQDKEFSLNKVGRIINIFFTT